MDTRISAGNNSKQVVDTKDAKDSSKSKKLLEILMQQNSQLEREIQRLHAELNEVTQGVMKRGYLHKFRDREISYASKWGLRYFVLQGSTLTYFADDKELRPRRSIDLTGCMVIDEGLKGGYYVFSIYWPTHEEENDTDAGTATAAGTMVGSLLIRLSSANRGDASQWIAVLEKATLGNQSAFPLAAAEDSANTNTQTTNALGLNIDDVDALGHDTDPGHAETLKRVRSSSLILQQSQARSPIVSPDRSSSGPDARLRAPSISSEQEARSSTVSATKPSAPAANGRGLQVSKSGRSLVLQSEAPPTRPSDRKRRFPASKPIHFECKYSPLSVEGRPSDQNYRGFFNLGVIILVLTNFRMISDNLLKYGLLLTIPGWNQLFPFLSVSSSSNFEIYDAVAIASRIGHELVVPAQCVASWLLSVSLSFTIEKIAAKNMISNRTALILVWIVSTANIIIPCVWTYQGQANPGLSMMYLMQSVVLWMKLISYNHVNRDLRKMYRSALRAQRTNSNMSGNRSPNPSSSSLSTAGLPSTSTDSLTTLNLNADASASAPDKLSIFQDVKDLQPPFLQYPQNLTVGNLLWFCVAPTLCYQLNYPRSPSIRWQYVFTILVRMFVAGCFMVFCVEQYISPTLAQSLAALKARDVPLIVIRLLKLSIPNTYVWLLMFYFYFHLWLNLLAELTRFGDRLFYKDWWNARTIDTYWRTWNLPVHHWMLRHLYYPILGLGFSQTKATVVVFLFSAVFHEVIISTPFKHFGLHAFLGMLAQAPLINVTKHLDKWMNSPTLGNVVFWCLFCVLGQPMGVILTHYDLSLKHAAAVAATASVEECLAGVCNAVASATT